jgi:hypothetical protein
VEPVARAAVLAVAEVGAVGGPVPRPGVGLEEAPGPLDDGGVRLGRDAAGLQA